MNGMDVTRRPSGKWNRRLRLGDEESEAALYEEPYRHLRAHVHPMRQRTRRETYRAYWWRHVGPRPGMWKALADLPRYIAAPTVSKHRLFIWQDARIGPDHQLIIITRADDTTFGILHSRFHEAPLRLRTWLGKGNDPRYTPATAFESFPFPEGLSPDIPASMSATDPHAIAVAGAARRLVELRDRWLSPPEWVAWTDGPGPNYSERSIPQDQTASAQLRRRILTNLYNTRPQWLVDAPVLDAAVAAAYGWPANIAAEEAMRELLKINLTTSR